jgi:Na+-translocating ferredoxin:NAD+ oxidoreductase RNF subunit RnfB
MSATARKPGRPAKSHSGRQRKASCPSCGFICYASASAYQHAGLPTCGCGEPLVIANLRDLITVDPEALDSLSERAHDAAMRELGHTDMIRAKVPPRRISQPQCAKDGCSRFRAYGVKFCAAHAELEEVPF